MPVLLSLQGGMAVGKTTAARYAAESLPWLHVGFENPMPAFNEALRRGFDQDSKDGFFETQRLFIEAEIKRFEESRQYPYALFDLGAEEIEFFTLYYPKSIGKDWDSESILAPELARLRRCTADSVLYLDAEHKTLENHRASDSDRKRGFFEHFVCNMADDKRAWFANRQNPATEFINVDDMNARQVGTIVARWAELKCKRECANHVVDEDTIRNLNIIKR